MIILWHSIQYNFFAGGGGGGGGGGVGVLWNH